MNQPNNSHLDTEDVISLLDMISLNILTVMNMLNRKNYSNCDLMLDEFLINLRHMIIEKSEQLKYNKNEQDKNEEI